MKSTFTFLFLIILYFFLVSGTINVAALFNYANQPIPNYVANLNNRDNTPNNNAITDAGATLGRVLFYDKNLSINNTISCASCHQQAAAFGDLATVSTGVDGTTERHSMRLAHARFAEEDRFFWDERAPSLEAQTTQPIQDHIEMGFSGNNGEPNLDSLIRKLNDIPYYQQLFPLAFNGSKTITEDRLQMVLAQFVRSIQSFDSKYDVGLAAANGNLNAPFNNFSQAENEGKALYMDNGDSGCNRCHRAPTFDIRDNSDNNGVVTVAGNPNLTDETNTRSPSLRNLFNPAGTLNGPLMHDGSFTSIDQVLDHYSDVPSNDNLDRDLRGRGGQRNFNETERANLIAFFKTLTSVNLYTDEKWADPFDTNGNLEILNGICATDTKVGTTISTGTYNLHASGSINSTNIIADATVAYQAGTAITLSPGFHANAGSSFSASIAACAEALMESSSSTEARTIADNSFDTQNSPLTLLKDTPNELTIFPNPFSQSITIEFEHSKGTPIDIYLFNATGQRIKYFALNQGTTINLGDLEKGIYFVKAIVDGQLIQTKKIIKN